MWRGSALAHPSPLKSERKVGRRNIHDLPAGLRWTKKDGYLLDLWWVDSNGKRRRRTKRLGNIPVNVARDLLAQERVRLLEGSIGKGLLEQVTVQEAFDRYLTWATTDRPDSLPMRRTAHARITQAYGKLRLRDLTPWHLERHKAAMLEKGYAKATINKDLAVTKHMLAKCVAWKLVSRETAHAIRDDVKLYPHDNIRVRFLSPTQIAALLAACPPDLRELVIGAMNLGQRAKALITLTWDCVNLEQGYVHFPKSTGRKKEAPVPIGINDVLRAALESAKARSRSPFVFTTKAGRQWSKSWLHEQFSAAAKKAGLDDFTFHDLRHHFASTLVQRNVPLQRVSRLLGHSQIDTTVRRYAHLAPEVERVTDVLTPPKEED